MIAQQPPVPALTVSAVVVQRWRMSRLTGGLEVTGTASRGGVLRGRLADARGRVLGTARLTVGPTGRLRGRVPLPRRMAPGEVVLTLREPAPPAGEAPLPARELRLRVAAPPEGVAGRAALTARRSALVLTVRFAVVPRAGLPLTVRVRHPDGAVRTVRGPSLRGRLLVARLPLARPPAGRWVARLDAGGRPVVLVRRVFPEAG
ncbi:MAG: hypothetical protein IT200_12555 [Thermoleophilia bacterium]|nr:hypothetical protein [Thermoleophilia bacterium]